MATLVQFLKTGSLGPIVLGMSPFEVIEQVGDPEQESQKKNPLMLKYGALQLVFWRTGSRSQLRDITLTFLPVFEGLPPAIELKDFHPRDKPTEKYFRGFLRLSNYPPTNETEHRGGTRMVFLSGVVVDFMQGLLQSIRISQKERRESTQIPLSDVREPSRFQIVEMIEESERTLEFNAYRPALLIGWAALEAILRRAAIKEGLQGQIGVQPTILIRELLSAGVLARNDRQLLEQLRQIRTATVHGLAPVDFSPRIIREMNAMSRRLLANMSYEWST